MFARFTDITYLVVWIDWICSHICSMWWSCTLNLLIYEVLRFRLWLTHVRFYFLFIVYIWFLVLFSWYWYGSLVWFNGPCRILSDGLSTRGVLMNFVRWKLVDKMWLFMHIIGSFCVCALLFCSLWFWPIKILILVTLKSCGLSHLVCC